MELAEASRRNLAGHNGVAYIAAAVKITVGRSTAMAMWTALVGWTRPGMPQLLTATLPTRCSRSGYAHERAAAAWRTGAHRSHRLSRAHGPIQTVSQRALLKEKIARDHGINKINAERINRAFADRRKNRIDRLQLRGGRSRIGH